MTFPDKLYVTREHCDDGFDDELGMRPCWTLSSDPEDTGWETDGGAEDYGLTFELATEIARRYNNGAQTG